MHDVCTQFGVIDRVVVRSFGAGVICLLRGLLGIHAQLLAHGGKNDDVDVLAILREELVDLLADFTVGDLDIVLGVAAIAHEREETVVSDIELQNA